MRDGAMLQAMRELPREASCAGWKPGHDDNPLPIAAGQTISQPYIVAFMSEALQLRAASSTAGSAPARATPAAVLGRLAIARWSAHAVLADNHGGSAERAAWTTSTVHKPTARWAGRRRRPTTPSSSPRPAEVPAALLAQLAVGDRLVMPVGEREGASVAATADARERA